MANINRIEKTKFLVWLLEGTRRRNGLRDVRTIHNFTQLIDFPATLDEIATVRTALESVIRNPLNVNLLRTNFIAEEEIFSKSAERIRNNKPLNKLKGTHFERALAALQHAKMERTPTQQPRSDLAEQIVRVIEGRETNDNKVKAMAVMLRSLFENGKPRNKKEEAIQRTIKDEGLEWAVGNYLETRTKQGMESRRGFAERVSARERKLNEVIRENERQKHIVHTKVERSNPNYFDVTNPLKQEERERARKKRLGGGGKGPSHGNRQHRMTPAMGMRRPYGRRR